MEKRVNFIIYFLYFIFIFLTIFLVNKFIIMKIYPVILGFFIACFLQNIIKKISFKLKISRKLSILICLSIFTFIIFCISYFTILSLNLINPNKIKESFTYISKYLENYNSIFLNFDAITKILLNWVEITYNILIKLLSFLPNLLANVLLTILSIIVFTFNYDTIYHIFAKYLYKNTFATTVISVCKNSLVTVLKAYFTLFLVVFCMLSIGFYILKIDYFIFLAFFAALLDLIPFLGLSSTFIPIILYNVISSNYLFAFNLSTLYVFCILVKLILEPKILSKNIGISPIVTMLCMIIGAKLFGFYGLLFAPISLIIAKGLYNNGVFTSYFL